MAIGNLIIPLPDTEYPDAQTGERDVTAEYIEKDVTSEYLPKPGALETIWDYAGEFGRQLESSLILAVKGKGGINAIDQDAYDAYVTGAKKASEDFIKKYGRDESILGSPLAYKDLAESVSSFPFSFISMGSGAGAGIGTLLATKNPTAAYAAGGAASGAAAYRISSAQVMQSYLSMINDIAVETDGNPLTKEEQEIYRSKFDGEAMKYGLWEAIPEALGNVSAVGIFFKKMTSVLGKHLATRMMAKLGGMYGTEITTEAITQHGQHNVEVRAGLQTGEERSMLSPSDWWQNIKEVAPQTFILVSVMGAGGGAGVQISARKKARAIVNAVDEGGHEQVPTEFLEKVVTEAQGAMEARPWDKKLASALDTLNGEMEKRKGVTAEQQPAAQAAQAGQPAEPEADVGDFMPPETDEGEPQGTTPTVGRPVTRLSAEYFEDLEGALKRGQDRNGESFTVADAEALYETYKSDPGAEPLSVRAFETVLAPYRAKEGARKTAAVEFSKFQTALDGKTFASDADMLAEHERIRQAYPHLSDKLNRAVVAYKSAQLQVGKESDQIPIEQPATITAAGTGGARGPVIGGIPPVAGGIPAETAESAIPEVQAPAAPEKSYRDQEAEKVRQFREAGHAINDHGVYAEREGITIPFNKSAKRTAEIRIAEAPDGFHYGIHISKNYGDHEGGGYAPSIDTKAYATREEVIRAAIEEIKGRIKDVDAPQGKAAMADLEKFAKAQGIEPAQAPAAPAAAEAGQGNQEVEEPWGLPEEGKDLFDPQMWDGIVIRALDKPQLLWDPEAGDSQPYVVRVNGASASFDTETTAENKANAQAFYDAMRQRLPKEAAAPEPAGDEKDVTGEYEEPQEIKAAGTGGKRGPVEATKAPAEEQDFAAKWDAMGYGGRQDIANASVYGSMRKVVHRLSGSKWAEISSGERGELRKAFDSISKVDEPPAAAKTEGILKEIAEISDEDLDAIINSVPAEKKEKAAAAKEPEKKEGLGKGGPTVWVVPPGTVRNAEAEVAQIEGILGRKLDEAEGVEEHAAAMQQAFDAWAAKYPDEAEKYRPIKKHGEASAVVTGKLSDFSILVNKTTTRGGTPVWNVSGDTRPHAELMKRLGARWYGPKKVWSFYNEDPSERILEALAGTKKAEAPEAADTAPDLEFAVTGQPKPVPGRPGLSYVVHKRKPDLIPHTYRVIISRQSPWLTIDGTGMTAEEAYSSALAQYDKKLPTMKDVKPAVVDVIESKGAALERYPIGTHVQYKERHGTVVGHHNENVNIRWDGSKQPWDMGVSPLDKDLKAAETKDKVAIALEAWKVFKETDLIEDKKSLMDLFRGLTESEKEEYGTRLSALQAELAAKPKAAPYRILDKSQFGPSAIAASKVLTDKPQSIAEIAAKAGISEKAAELGLAELTQRGVAGWLLSANKYEQGSTRIDYGREEAAGPDLAAKSTTDLVKDIFSIINDHIGEKGSIPVISGKPKIEDSLYQKLKPYLGEIAKRARAKALDVKAYLFGAVDSMPEGQAKNIYETAANHYISEENLDLSSKTGIIESTERGEEDVAAITGHAAETGAKVQHDKGRAEGEGAGAVSRTEEGRPTQTVSPGSRRSDDGELSGRGGITAEQSPGSEGTDRVLGEGEGPGGRIPAAVGTDAGELAGLQRYGKGKDHRIGIGGLTRTGSWKDAARNNLDAIELAKLLETEGRPATPEEQSILAKYVGWGSSELANKMFPGFANNGEVMANWADRDWRTLVERLINVMTPEEIKTAARSTQYAHYTSEPIIRSIYNILERFGFTGGKMLEPGVGVGNFIGLIPDSMRKGSKYTGVEMDNVTALIAKHLYPQQNIIHGDFSKTQLPKNFFDLAIGNPPFSDLKILADPEYRDKRFSLHEYFFAKSIDRTRPGGLLVFVTSRYAMDKVDDKARKYLADRADLIGAIRLPQTAFKQHAGTEVVTDVIFLRKRAMGETPAGAAWNSLKEVQTPEGPTLINEYFADRPEMVLGRNSLQGKMYRSDEYTVLPFDGNIEDHFAKAAEHLPGGIYDSSKSPTAEIEKGAVERDFNPKNKKEGGLYVNDKGQLMQVDYGSGVLFDKDKHKIDEKGVPWLKDYCGLRDVLKQAQYDQLTDGASGGNTLRGPRKKEYKDFVKKTRPYPAIYPYRAKRTSMRTAMKK